MNRREYLASIGGVGLAAIAGCAEEAETGTGGTTTDRTTTTTSSTTEGSTTTESTTETASEESTTEESTTETGTQSPTYQVRIGYDGDWSGAITTGDSTRSIDGSGTETIDIEGDPVIVSANAQKQDDSSRELTVAILEDGEVIAEQSTSANYGVAQVTSEDGSGSGGDTGESPFEVRIQYSGDWQGSVGTGGSTRSIEGSGERTIAIEGDPSIITVNAQKQGDGSGELTVQILEDGEVVKEASTTAEYGVAQVTYSNL